MPRHAFDTDTEPAEPFFPAEAFKNIDPLTLFPRDNSGEVVVTRLRTKHLEIADRLFEPQPAVRRDAAVDEIQARGVLTGGAARTEWRTRSIAVLTRRADTAGTVAFIASLVLAIVMTVMAPLYFE